MNDQELLGTCDTCQGRYDVASRDGRCGECGECATHCTHLLGEPAVNMESYLALLTRYECVTAGCRAGHWKLPESNYVYVCDGHAVKVGV
jgi:hypothetical protein